MSRKKKLKRRIRDRQSKTKERYTTARSQVLKAEAKKQGSQCHELESGQRVARAHCSLATTSHVSAAKAFESLATKSYPSAAKAIQSLAAKRCISAAEAIQSLAAKSYASVAEAIDSLARESYASGTEAIDSLARTATASMDQFQRLQKNLSGANLALQRQLVTNPALVIQRQIEEQMASARTPIDEFQQAFREVGKRLRLL